MCIPQRKQKKVPQRRGKSAMTMLCVENGDDDDDDDENDYAWFSPVCFCSLFSFFCKGMPLFFPFSIPRLLLDAHATR